jgi:3-phosphoshikimate 1-carboxyvinyltransferase
MAGPAGAATAGRVDVVERHAFSRDLPALTAHRPLPAGPLQSRRGQPLSGTIAVPGDKSISHRALMFGGLAVGETVIHGLLEGEDVLATAAAMTALGAVVEHGQDGIWRVRGRGIGGLVETANVLDLGNSGTSTRLLMGVVATSPMVTFFTGDASLRSRPMARIVTPLSEMGTRFVSRAGHRLPLAVIGTASPVPITYRLPVASAQVKSAILLAGLNAPGETTVIETVPSRDHTELMLRNFGATLRETPLDDGATAVTVVGQPELIGRPVHVPGDPSSAGFPLVAALIVPDSHVTLRAISLNPRRTGLLQTLQEMGADIAIANKRVEAGEPAGDVTVRFGRLTGVEVPPERAPSMIDEYPILAVAAAFAKGRTIMRGLHELRVKESDRLEAVAKGLASCGVAVEVSGDDLIVTGSSSRPRGGATIATNLDHRIAMAFLVLGLATDKPVTVDDGRPIDTSFPGFVSLMGGLGAAIEIA